MIRLFAAVAVPPEVGEELTERMHGLPGARWRTLEQLHVTLRFYGDIQEDRAADLDGELARIACPPLELALTGVGSFGDLHQRAALWAGVEENAALRALATRCESAAKRAGLKPETRSYKPHVTLAYLRGAERDKVGAWLGKHGLLRTAPFRVTWFGLYSSVLHPDGGRYQLEREYPLL